MMEPALSVKFKRVVICAFCDVSIRLVIAYSTLNPQNKIARMYCLKMQ